MILRSSGDPHHLPDTLLCFLLLNVAVDSAVGTAVSSDAQGRIQRLGVSHLEVKMVCGLSGGSVAVPIRVLASNPTGYAVRVETYYEVRRRRRRGRGRV